VRATTSWIGGASFDDVHGLCAPTPGAELEDLLEADAQYGGDAESRLKRGEIFALIDGDYGLARHADGVGEDLLNPLAVFKTQGADTVCDTGWRPTHAQAPC